MRPRLPSIVLTLLLGLSIPFHGTAQSIALPDFGDPSRRYLSAGDERRLGSAVLQRLRNQGVIIDDVQLNEYLDSVGQRIAAYTDQTGHPFTFFLVRDPSINAFAAPGGFIGVHSGLLLATQSEDELAGVIAHEIAHVSQRHISRTFADAQRLSLPVAAAMLASVLVAAIDRQAGQAALAGTLAASAQRRINFTRANEQEADRIGTQLLYQAGFDPNGMAAFFRRLERLSGSSTAQLPEYLRTHPLPANRIADTQDRFNRRPAPRAPRDNAAYYLTKARTRVLTTPNTGNLLREYRTTLAKGDYADETAERYGYALALKRAGRYPDAQEQIALLRKDDPDRLAFLVEEADIALAKGDRERAWRLFEDAKGLYGDDFTLVMHYGQALAVQGDPHKAMEILQPQLRRRTNDAPLYALYAQAAQRAGETATTHATLAEYYYLNGELHSAIEQAELGLKNPQATPYQQAQLRARLRQFKEEAEAQEQH